MIDYLKLSVFFKDEFLTVCKSGERHLKFEMLSVFGFNLSARRISYVKCWDSVHGKGYRVEDIELNTPWESLPSSFSGIALKIWDSNSMGDPRLEIKASPAKIMQGHNVFGSTSIETGAFHMLRTLQDAYPDLVDAIDWPRTTVDIIDATYSARLSEPSHQLSFIKFLRNVANGQMRRSVHSDDYETTTYLTSMTSKKRVLKVYLKSSEIQNEISKLDHQLQKNPANVDLQKRLEVLKDEKLLMWADGLVRFEARLKKDWFKRMGYPVLLSDWVRLQKKMLRDGLCLIEALWNASFQPLLEALKGEGVNMQNEDKVHNKLKICFFTPTKKGVSYAKADRVFSYYMRLINEGYDKVYRTMNKNTFGRFLKDLVNATGMSKAQLQNLSADSQTNIIPFCKAIQIDFSAQRPNWYVEPVSNLTHVNFDIKPLRVVNF